MGVIINPFEQVRYTCQYSSIALFFPDLDICCMPSSDRFALDLNTGERGHVTSKSIP